MWRWGFLSAVMPMLFLGVAYADGIQAQCGSEAGRSFLAEGGLVGRADRGWQDDTMTGETVIRIDTDTGAVDVRFRDAFGVWQAVSDQGGSASLFAARDVPPAFVVVVAYPGTTVEVMTIAELEGDSAVLIHTLSRATDRITNSRVMTARCRVTAY